jgi:hypothetical protein
MAGNIKFAQKKYNYGIFSVKNHIVSCWNIAQMYVEVTVGCTEFIYALCC